MPPRLPAPTLELFRRLAPHAAPPLRAPLGNAERISGAASRLLALAGPEAAALARTTVAVTTLEGSPALNVIPAAAKAGVNVRILPGDSVAVIGPGPIGLLAMQFAASYHPSKLIVIGTRNSRLEFARGLGATHTINIDEITDHAQRAEMVKGLTDGRGAEFCIEAAGVPEAFLQGFDFMRKDCTYLVMGQTSTKTVPFMPNMLQQKQACVIGSGGADARHFYKALKFIEAHRGRIDFSKIISSTYDLEEINTALDNMASGADIKGAVRPHGLH
jgi:threonine dehydrogenase-like Zn-dependent dehydrogenase